MSRRVYELHFDGEPDTFRRMDRLWRAPGHEATRWQRWLADVLAIGATVVIVALLSAMWVAWKCGWRHFDED